MTSLRTGCTITEHCLCSLGSSVTVRPFALQAESTERSTGFSTHLLYPRLIRYTAQFPALVTFFNVYDGIRSPLSERTTCTPWVLTFTTDFITKQRNTQSNTNTDFPVPAKLTRASTNSPMLEWTSSVSSRKEGQVTRAYSDCHLALLTLPILTFTPTVFAYPSVLTGRKDDMLDLFTAVTVQKVQVIGNFLDSGCNLVSSFLKGFCELHFVSQEKQNVL